MRLVRLAIAGLVVGCAPASTTSAAPEGLKLSFPLACQIGRTCEVQHYVDRDPGPAVKDYRCGRRTYEDHSGIDIRLLDMAAQRRGVDVLAAAPGRVARLRDGVEDISIRAQGAPPVEGQECGNGVVIDHGDGWETQYCHLAKGSVRVKVGDTVTGGTPIAQVGLSGNTEFPHLHLTVRRNGQRVDPFAPDASQPASCNAQTPLWDASAMRQMTYKAGEILNVGFAPDRVSMADVEAGAIAAPTAQSAFLVAYMRAIELEGGDQVVMTLTGPGGAPLASSAIAPLDRDKAQYIAFVGKRRPASGWPAGVYAARVQVLRGGKAVIERRFETRLGSTVGPAPRSS